MRDQEITGLYQAYLDVYSNSNEEVEQLDENVQGAVKGALEKGANFMKTNPVGKAVGSIIAPVNSGRKTPTATSGGYRKEEVEELDESGLSQDTIRSAVRKRQERVDADYRKDTPEGDKRGDEGMKKLARSKRQLKINEPREVRMRANEEVENWVNSLIDEGYDLSEYTWDDMYEMYVTEADSIAAMRERAAKRRKQRYGASDTSRGGRDDFAPITDYEAANKKWERPTQKENVDFFDAILEHLVAEGYADTNESALVIMANMSEDWRESIVEEVISEDEKPFPYEKVKRKQVALRDKGSAGLERRMRMGTAVRRAKETEKTGGSQQDAGKGWYHGK